MVRKLIGPTMQLHEKNNSKIACPRTLIRGWHPIFGKACPRARPEGSCTNKKLDRCCKSIRSEKALALQLHFILTSESMDHHDSEDHGWWEHRSRRRLSFGRLRYGM